ncbi:RecX family transcriptional regulator [Natroniella sp. ANB-PHB2]|uniref:RecX family transcriptional regulator n=1 Tax=Natroniella sp. ANB-PHB2 TaxID=3384444 RepID=UPI0038D3E2A2
MKSIGKITKIEQQKNNQDRCSIFLDQKFLVGINAELIHKLNLNVGDEITEDLLKQLLSEESLLQAKQAAFNLLSYRQRSRQELQNRLAHKGFEFGVIEQVIEVLKRLDYLDDREFANNWIKDRKRKKFGPWRIKRQLQEKGVAINIIEEELSKEYDFELECKLAFELAKKKSDRYRGLDFREQRYKLGQVLKRKGFSFETVNIVLDKLDIG